MLLTRPDDWVKLGFLSVNLVLSNFIRAFLPVFTFYRGLPATKDYKWMRIEVIKPVLFVIFHLMSQVRLSPRRRYGAPLPFVSGIFVDFSGRGFGLDSNGGADRKSIPGGKAASRTHRRRHQRRTAKAAVVTPFADL